MSIDNRNVRFHNTQLPIYLYFLCYFVSEVACSCYNSKWLTYLYKSYVTMQTVSHCLFVLETSGGSTHSFAPVQEVSDQSHETLRPPASIAPSCDEVTDGVRNIQITSPIESTDTGNLPSNATSINN